MDADHLLKIIFRSLITVDLVSIGNSKCKFLFFMVTKRFYTIITASFTTYSIPNLTFFLTGSYENNGTDHDYANLIILRKIQIRILTDHNDHH